MKSIATMTIRTLCRFPSLRLQLHLSVCLSIFLVSYSLALSLFVRMLCTLFTTTKNSRRQCNLLFYSCGLLHNAMHTNISRCFFFINLLSNAIPFRFIFARAAHTLTFTD